MAIVTADVQPAVKGVTLDLTLAEAQYVAGVLSQSSQHHTTMRDAFDIRTASVWHELVHELDAAGGLVENEYGAYSSKSGVYERAAAMVSFTPPKP